MVMLISYFCKYLYLHVTRVNGLEATASGPLRIRQLGFQLSII